MGDIEDYSGVTPDEHLAAGTAMFSVDRALRVVEVSARVTPSQDAEAFASGFTEDCVVQFPPHPTIFGRAAVERRAQGFFETGRQRFVCEKRLRSISGNVLGVVWVNRWIDPDTSLRRMSKGVEFWVMRGERISRWDAVATTWDVPS